MEEKGSRDMSAEPATTTNYVHVDTNGSILDIGIRLGGLRAAMEYWNTFSMREWVGDEGIEMWLDDCLEAWMEYNALMAPLQMYTITSGGTSTGELWSPVGTTG
ncbi:hypothetical protein LCGC14_2425860 [marine sediment metagenome]|uniref:Uncharacterized protein n=1 Tax=marine sediment metagenome TaxID=412755 RepID=A0A0F9BNC7_9ZZZZ